MSVIEDYEDLAREIVENPEARAIVIENDIRRAIAQAFEARRKERRLTVRALGDLLGTSKSQVQRLLHKELGGSLTLNSIVRAAIALDLDLRVTTEARRSADVVAISEWKEMQTSLSAASKMEPQKVRISKQIGNARAGRNQPESDPWRSMAELG